MEKDKTFLYVLLVAGIVAFLWWLFNNNPKARQIIQQAANTLGIPNLGPINIDGGSGDIDIPLAQLGPAMDVGCCPKCEGVNSGYPMTEPVKQTGPATYQTILNYIYNPLPPPPQPKPWPNIKG